MRRPVRKAVIELEGMSFSLTCPTRKLNFPSKAAARIFLRRKRLTGQRPYDCPEAGCGQVHVGFLPQAVKEGRMTADEFYTP